MPNGLLLRADIHTLFDLHLIGVDQTSRRITIALSLRESVYSEIHGSTLATTCVPAQEASIESLAWHRSHCPW
ncbi:HNH endonuclease [Stenotrophomonas geniculata]|uniref:HNH endonuclease n=1 Tax=Stenotrophomonas geniculata TaxID=86188 RepID=UPI003D2C9B55